LKAEKLFFTIIIPLYNGSKTIELTLNSILYQNYENYEVIVIDDCSTDNSLSIAKNRLAYTNINRKIYSNKVNRGTFYCWNRGLKLAKGDYIIIAPQDNIMTLDRLDNLNHFILRENRPDIITSNIYDGDINDYNSGKGIKRRALVSYLRPSIYNVFLLKSTLFEFDTIVTKNSVSYLFHNLSEYSPCEDFSFVTKIIHSNNKYIHAHLSNSLVYKIRSSESQTHKNAVRIANSSINFIRIFSPNILIKFLSISAVENILFFRYFSATQKKNFLIQSPLMFISGTTINLIRLILRSLLSDIFKKNIKIRFNHLL
jgi:glycosyltransferase involved in cell wall biosynthesis